MHATTYNLLNSKNKIFEGTFKYNGEECIIKGKECETIQESISSFFDECLKAGINTLNDIYPSKKLIIKPETTSRYTFTIEKPDHSKVLRVINQERPMLEQLVSEYVALPYALLI